MEVFFRTNLGSADAKKFGIDQYVAGESADVSKEAGDGLVAAGIATTNADDPIVRSAQGKPDKEDEKAKPKVKAVAKTPDITAPLK